MIPPRLPFFTDPANGDFLRERPRDPGRPTTACARPKDLASACPALVFRHRALPSRERVNPPLGQR
jgi:hypothetical protein